MTTSEKQVFQLLSFLVQTEDHTVAFQPSLNESQLYKFVCAMQICDENNSVPIGKQLGKYINECMTTKCNENIEVVGCFGRQEAVKAELIRRGLCSPCNFAEESKLGIYAIVDPNTPRKVVLYTWLQNDSFQSDLLQQRATYALRFLTTLTSNVIVCLTSEDWNAVIAASNAMSDDEENNYTEKLQIVDEDPVKECVSCEFISTAALCNHNWHKLPSSTNYVMSVQVESCERMQANEVEEESMTKEDFVLWLHHRLQTYKVSFETYPPEICMTHVLKKWGLHPKQLYDAKKENLDIEIENAAYKRVNGLKNELIDIADSHFKQGSKMSEEVMDEMTKIMNKALGDDLKVPKDMNLVEIINSSIDKAKKNKKNAEAKSESKYTKWKSNLHSFVLNKVSAAKSQLRREEPWITKRRDIENYNSSGATKKLFDLAIEKRNNTLESPDHIKVKFDEGYIWTIHYTFYHNVEHLVHETKVHLRGNSQVGRIGTLSLHHGAKILYINHFCDKVLLIFLLNGFTHIEVWGIDNFEHKYFENAYPHEALLCDFDESSRTLALQESQCAVGLYTFNAEYSVLKKIVLINLRMMEITLPLKNLLCFGGENPGVLVVGDDSEVQLYHWHMKRYGVVMHNFHQAKTAVKMKEFIFFLTETNHAVPQDDIAQNIDKIASNMKSEDNQVSLEHTTILSHTADEYSGAEKCSTKSRSQILIQTIVPTDGSPLQETTLLLPEEWTLDDVEAESSGDYLVLLNTKTMQMATYKMTIVVGQSNFQLKSLNSYTASTEKKDHLLDCFFHVHDMFPIQAMLDEKSTAKKRLYLHIGTESNEQHDALKSELELIMDKIKELKKPMAKLDLIEDLEIYDISNPPDITCLESVISIWILNLVGLVPVRICRTQNNQLILLRHGAQVNYKGGAAHIVAPQIDFGPISHVLWSWTGEVIVPTSMGKQSTGKSYYLNHVTGSSFAVSGARCTEGAWLTLRVFGNKLLVVLDFEGLGSFERSNQEDLLLAILNAGISRLSIFRIDMRFDKDIDEMFTKFQKGVSNLKGDKRLYKGELEFNIRDVSQTALKSVKGEFTRKIRSLMDPSRPDNFISVMYSGFVNLTCSPPFGQVKFYKAMSTVVKKLEATEPYVDGKDFHECLSMVLAKIVMADWTEMSANFHAKKAMEIRNNIPIALQYGKLEDTSIGDEVDETIKLRQAALDSKLTLPPDSDLKLEMDWEDSEPDLPLMKQFFSAMYDSYVQVPRTIANDKMFDEIFQFMLWRREHRVTQWFKSLSWKDRNEHEYFESCVGKMLKLFRRCKVKCAICYLTCFESHQHAEDVPHCCGTSHKCGGICSFCTDKKSCGLPAGHSSSCNCKVINHTCSESCQWKNKSNDCNGTCSLEIEHEGPHECGEFHRCKEKCQAPKCAEFCQHFVGKDHDVHKCTTPKCIQLCSFPGCTKPCATKDHFHAPDDGYHDCMNKHNCPGECASSGICEVTVVESLSTTIKKYRGRRSDFTYKQREMNGKKKLCAIVLAPGKRNHEGILHACEVEIHKCDQRCPCCEYYCEEPFGHVTPLHKTSHGNMKNTIFLSTQNEIDIGDRKYEAGEQGIAEWCSEFCANMGRGHVHYLECEASSKDDCNNTHPGRRHCTETLTPTPRTQMDEVLHKTYWNILGWEDPVANNREISKCPYLCKSLAHEENEPSYCMLDAWHDDLPANDARGKECSRSIIDGHLFHCNHYRSTERAHHVFVLDESDSMSKNWAELQSAVKTYLSHQMKHGHDLDVVSIINFATKSRIFCERMLISQIEPHSIEHCGGFFNSLILNGLTNYVAGFQTANSVLSRTDFSTYTPILLFFTDGYPNRGGDYREITRKIYDTYKCYKLQVHIVGFGKMNMTQLESIASDLGGTFHTSVQGTLVSTFASIAKSVTTTFSLHHRQSQTKVYRE